MCTVAPHAGWSFLQSKIAGACVQSFAVKLCALSIFRKQVESLVLLRKTIRKPSFS